MDVVGPKLGFGLRHQLSHRSIVVFMAVGHDDSLYVAGTESGARQAVSQLTKGPGDSGVDKSKAFVLKQIGPSWTGIRKAISGDRDGIDEDAVLWNNLEHHAVAAGVSMSQNPYFAKTMVHSTSPELMHQKPISPLRCCQICWVVKLRGPLLGSER